MPAHQSQPVQAMLQPPLKGIQILLVEDELDVANLLLFVLQRAGATVRLCNEAESALAILESFHPNVLVSNIKLPSQDGTWLIEQIRRHPRPEIQRLPAIGVTSYDREVSVSGALEAGFDCFLSKLDSTDAIVEAISTLVAPV